MIFHWRRSLLGGFDLMIAQYVDPGEHVYMVERLSDEELSKMTGHEMGAWLAERLPVLKQRVEDLAIAHIKDQGPRC